MRRVILILAVCAVAMNMQFRPAGASGNAQLVQFASCTGRLSAQMEFQWMFDGAASELTATHRAAMIELIDAIIAPGDGRDVLYWRLSAKRAQAALLTRATFNDDTADAAWAARTATRLADECASLILG